MTVPTVPLGSLCKPKQWKTLSKREMVHEGFPVYGANGRIGYSETYTHEHPVILIGCRGSCGSVHMTEPHAYANGNAMALDQLDTDRADINYLQYYLRYRGFRDVISGSSQPQIIVRNIVKVDVWLPPLAEQKRIAAILDAADALRQKRRESLTELDTLIQSVFLDMFGDPVTNPKGWATKPLAELGSLDRGVSKHRPRNEPSLLGGMHPLIQTGDVANAGGYIRVYSETYSDAGLLQSKKWPAGTLCITIAANIANTGILTFDACFPDSVVGFRSDNPGRAEYVQGLFWFLRDMLEKKAPQVAQKNINLKILRGLSVPVPEPDLERRFASFVEASESQKAAQRAHLAELDNLFASLQQRAFAGEL